MVGFIFVPIGRQLPINEMQKLEILKHSLLRKTIWLDSNFYKFIVNFLLNFDIDYFVYSHQGVGITSEHWLADILLFITTHI